MLETLKSLPNDPDDLQGLVALMGEENKSLTLKVEDLQGSWQPIARRGSDPNPKATISWL